MIRNGRTADGNGDRSKGHEVSDRRLGRFLVRAVWLTVTLWGSTVVAPVRAGDADRTGSGKWLTIDRIFASNEFSEETVGPYTWGVRGDSFWFVRRGAGDSELVWVDLVTGEAKVQAGPNELTPPGGKRPLQIARLRFSADGRRLLLFTNTRRVWRYHTRGDYWVFDLPNKTLQQVGRDAPEASLMFAKFSPDGTFVAYVREGQIYLERLRDGQVERLTPATDPRVINGTSDWVNEEELDIRDGFRWSPRGDAIAFWQFDTRGVRRFHLIDNTSGKYPRIISFPYPKVGEVNSATRIGVVHLDPRKIVWLQLPGDPRQHYIPQMEWAPDGVHILVQRMNRLQNENRVYLADSRTGEVREIFCERDEAWLENENPVRWLDNGNALLWLSERTGWRHAYYVNMRDGSARPVTRGAFDVIDIEGIDRENNAVYFAASPNDATRRYLYRVGLGGGVPKRLTPADKPGWHTYDVSPNGRWAVHRYSTFTRPPEVSLIRLADHKVIRTLAENKELRRRLERLLQPKVDFFRVPIAGGVELDGWRISPPQSHGERRHPVLFFVYGEPRGQTVRDAWTGRRGLWHWMLAQRGIIVASVDNRGTYAPRGRAWRKFAFRRIGIVAPEDQAAAARALLASWPTADPQRVATWGWSGGGSMSLHAIFRFPEIYGTAIAVAPNPCQWLYDTIYQERYMGLPDQNWEGYVKGSPITYAKQLRGNLLIVHGTLDDNVHYQSTEMLVNELIKHKKLFRIMPYPGRTHAISEGPNTRRHLFLLMTRFLEEHLGVQVLENP